MSGILRRIWDWVSGLGTEVSADHNEKRRIILTNRIYVALFFIMLLVTILTIIKNKGISFGFTQAGLVVIVSVLGLVFSRIHWVNLSKLMLCTVPVSIIFFYPVFRHHIINEYFFWFSYAAIPSSLFPNIIFSVKKPARYYLFVTEIYVLLLIVFAEEILMYAMTKMCIRDSSN